MKKLLLMAALALAGCEGKLGGPSGPATPVEPEADAGCPPEGKNDEIRAALAPACASCHTSGNKPYFASLDAFENGLVYDPKWVNKDDPENSGLILLLQGRAPGSYPQMPPGEPYTALETDGRAKISLADLKAWIRELPPRGVVNDGPSPEAFTVRRLRADEMILSLMDQLGLSPADFVDTSRPTWRNEEFTVRGGRLFTWPTDWAPGISQQYVSDKRATERYETLGGAVILQGRKNDVGLGPSSVQTLVQVSQAWCRIAIEKTGNTSVLRHVTLADKSATKSVEIRQNIASLSLRMLGEVPTDAQVTEMYEQVYLPLEPASTRAAWTGVCAALVRHPQWLSY
ncbi:MAG: hypothetical protein Q8K32_25685 [Archangium sp.]|nr:hypothetical protein [Archangium sp.]